MDDGFFDMLTKSQSRRLDDQRCTFVPSNNKSPARKGLNNTDELLDILQKMNDRYVTSVEYFVSQVYYCYQLYTGWRNRDPQRNQLSKRQQSHIPAQVQLPLHPQNHSYLQHHQHRHHQLLLQHSLNQLQMKISLNY